MEASEKCKHQTRQKISVSNCKWRMRSELHFGSTVGFHLAVECGCTSDLIGCEVGVTSGQPMASIEQSSTAAPLTCSVAKWVLLPVNRCLPFSRQDAELVVQAHAGDSDSESDS